ncbi:MAG: type II secretion system protein [Magnetococcales bacterium]|nr:type II secretion system protein [Magnetococcales bacterium]
MKSIKFYNSSGYSLIELVFVIVILGVSAVGVLPMFSQALFSAQKISEMHQGQMLAQEAINKVVKDKWGEVGFTGIVASLSQVDIGGPLIFEEIVEVEGGIYNSSDNSIFCSGSTYTDENYKCVTIKIKIAFEEEILAKRWIIISK